MKPPQQFILWYIHGVEQRILHAGVYPGGSALRLGVLTYVGTPDHETFDLGELSQPPAPDIEPLLRRDEIIGRVGDDEFGKTVEAFMLDGLLKPVPVADIHDRGLDPASLPGPLLVMDRAHLARLAADFGSVRRRVTELLTGAPTGPDLAAEPVSETLSV